MSDNVEDAVQMAQEIAAKPIDEQLSWRQSFFVRHSEQLPHAKGAGRQRV